MVETCLYLSLGKYSPDHCTTIAPLKVEEVTIIALLLGADVSSVRSSSVSKQILLTKLLTAGSFISGLNTFTFVFSRPW